MSLQKVSLQLEAEGTVSPKTKKRFTPTAIRHAAWRWALQGENQETAYKDVRERMAKNGRIISSEDWKKIMVENATFVWGQTPHKLNKFIEKFNLQNYA